MNGKNKTTAERPLHPHWLVMQKVDPDMLRKCTEWRGCIMEHEAIPAKYKELMMVSMCSVIRFTAGTKIHAQYAIEKGATKDELFEAIALSMLIGGVPAYREGIMTINELI